MKLLKEDIKKEDIYLGTIVISFKDFDIADGSGELFLNSKGAFIVDDNLSGRERFRTLKECKEYLKDVYEDDGDIDYIYVDWVYPGLSKLIKVDSIYDSSIYNKVAVYIDEEERKDLDKRKEAEKNFDINRDIDNKKVAEFFNKFNTKDKLEKVLVDEKIISSNAYGEISFSAFEFKIKLLDAYHADSRIIDNNLRNILGVTNQDLFSRDSAYLKSVYNKYHK